jgi:hypothetical protein
MLTLTPHLMCSRHIINPQPLPLRPGSSFQSAIRFPSSSQYRRSPAILQRLLRRHVPFPSYNHSRPYLTPQSNGFNHTARGLVSVWRAREFAGRSVGAGCDVLEERIGLF